MRVPRSLLVSALDAYISELCASAEAAHDDGNHSHAKEDERAAQEAQRLVDEIRDGESAFVRILND